MEVLQIIRDVAIIILAVESIVIGAAVLFLVIQVWKVVGLARRHMDTLGTSASGILGTVQQTAHTVADTAKSTQGTVGFVADRTAKPVIEMYAVISGASRFARAVFRRDAGQDRSASDGTQATRTQQDGAS